MISKAIYDKLKSKIDYYIFFISIIFLIFFIKNNKLKIIFLYIIIKDV